jgi:DoxX-like protein
MKITKTIGWIMTLLPVALMTFSAVSKLLKTTQVLEGFSQLQVPEHLLIPIGLLELGCLAVYLFPWTSVLGAILLTGYLGGAVLTHLRVGDPKFIMPAILGVVAWGGIFLREPRLRALIPLRRE